MNRERRVLAWAVALLALSAAPASAQARPAFDVLREQLEAQAAGGG